MTNSTIPYREGEAPPGPGYILVHIEDEDGNDQGLAWALEKDLKVGPIRHENLDDFGPVLRWTWRHLKQYITSCRTFEDWELGFMRDTQPEREIAIWMRITYAFLEFTYRHPSADKMTVFASLIKVTEGRDNVVRPKNVVRQLKRLMSNPPRVLANIEHFTADGHLNTTVKYLR